MSRTGSSKLLLVAVVWLVILGLGAGTYKFLGGRRGAAESYTMVELEVISTANVPTRNGESGYRFFANILPDKGEYSPCWQ